MNVDVHFELETLRRHLADAEAAVAQLSRAVARAEADHAALAAILSRARVALTEATGTGAAP